MKVTSSSTSLRRIRCTTEDYKLVKMGHFQITVLVFLLSVITHVSALSCVNCIHMEVIPAHPPGFQNVFKNMYCKNYHPEILRANSMECLNDRYVCAVVDGMYTFDAGLSSFIHVNATVRRCVLKPPSLEAKVKPICLAGNELDKAGNEIHLVGASDTFGDMTQFDGKVCYCNGHDCNAASTFGRHAVLLSIITWALVALVKY